jgi:hypothetical protein
MYIKILDILFYFSGYKELAVANNRGTNASSKAKETSSYHAMFLSSLVQGMLCVLDNNND